ncbi:MAG: alpha/beta hydrolase [Microbacterium sp.]|jgi:pimeloyl-ACP methyl ester carboxylesterase|nr:alpha/beta hydrolase [Microbacterium sp.]MDF2554358.1 alpha/beta hydrolase [Microbacterium sp.]
MDIILVPGLWLDASSWHAVVPAISRAGHTPVPLTMPGTGGTAAATAAIGIADWVDAVAARIDAADAPVVLVGHSGGGNVVWGAADARADRVTRVVLVDTALPASGAAIAELPVVDGMVPFPGWDFFDQPDTADLDDRTRRRAAEMTASIPARVPADALVLSDPRRFSIPVTVLSGTADAREFTEMLAEWPSYAEEFARVRDTEIVRLGTGHWPQFSQPERLGEAIVAAVDRSPRADG